MKIFLYSFSLLLLSSTSLANDPEQAVRLLSEVLGTSRTWGQSPAPTCEEGQAVGQVSVESRSQARNSTSRMPPLDASFSGRGADCSAFISSNGSLGPLGQTIADSIVARGPNSPLLADNRPGMSDGIRACPKWRQLSQQDRIHFWVWTFTAIAWDESTCMPNARNANATNGVAVGLMQLDEQLSARSWRGPNCRSRSVAGATQNVLCSLDIMEELMKGRQGVYKTNGHLWGSNSYWQKLRARDGGNIGRMVKTFTPCH